MLYIIEHAIQPDMVRTAFNRRSVEPFRSSSILSHEVDAYEKALGRISVREAKGDPELAERVHRVHHCW